MGHGKTNKMSQHGCGSMDACHYRHCVGPLDDSYSSIRGLSSPDDMGEKVRRGIDVLSWYLVSTLAAHITSSSPKLTFPQCHSSVHPPPEIALFLRRGQQLYMEASESRPVVNVRAPCRSNLRLHPDSPPDLHPRNPFGHQLDTRKHPAKQRERKRQ